MSVSAIRLSAAGFAVAILACAACGSSSVAQSPTTPTPTSPGPPNPVAPALAAPGVKSPIGGETIAGLRPTLSVTNAAASGSVGAVTYQFELSEVDSFPANSRTSAAGNVAQGNGVTSWQPPSELIPGFLYYWHARATNGTITTDWSKTETFKTP